MAKPGPDPRVSKTEILREMRLSPDPVVTATEVAERTGYSGSSVNNKLDELVDEGFVKSKQAGARAVVYWLTDEGREELAKRA